MILSEMDIDLEKKELDVRRQLFEADLKYVLFAGPAQSLDQGKRGAKRVELEDFKLAYEREYEVLRNYLQDDTLHGRFEELKNKVNEFVRKIKKVQSKEELDALQEEISKECPLIDFSQSLTDKDAYLILGKRPSNSQKSHESSPE